MPWVTNTNIYNNTTTATQWINVTQTVTSSTTINHYPLYSNQWNAIQTGIINNQYYWIDSNMGIQHAREEHWVTGSGDWEPRIPRVHAEPRINSALNRARDLLLSQLTDEQRAHLVEHNWFVVIGSRSRRRYKIDAHHIVANVRRLDDGARLCAHCNDNLPISDHLLAQKLMIENDEDSFLAIANRHP
jgi:hypothetical protein